MRNRALIETAVFPVAGRGTRFCPTTKASPKEMLPVVDKPLIQYAVEEALAAGARRLVFITGASKRAIEDHFDSDQELEGLLRRQGKSELLRQLRSVLPSYATCIYIRQPAPLGLGHAVLCARPALGDQPFFVHLADDLIDAQTPVLAQMAAVHAARGGSVIGCQTVPRAETDRYGIVATQGRGVTQRITAIVEKPKPAQAPSTLAVVGRYLLMPRVFDHLARIGRGAGGEIQLTDGISRLLGDEAVYAHRFEGRRYDCGSKLGYLQATVAYALAHPELGTPFRAHLRSVVSGRAAAGRRGSTRSGSTRSGSTKE
jgi:UTP--glucose-1-phosphate uridylyltransferase